MKQMHLSNVTVFVGEPGAAAGVATSVTINYRPADAAEPVADQPLMMERVTITCDIVSTTVPLTWTPRDRRHEKN